MYFFRKKNKKFIKPTNIILIWNVKKYFIVI